MKRENEIYAAILLIPFMGGVAARLLRVTIAFLLRDYGLSVTEIALLSSTFMLARAVLSPIIGKFADMGYRRLYFIMFGLLGLAVDSSLYILVPYPYMLFLRALDGMYGAMVWPSMQAFVHMASHREKRARVMSLYFIMGSLGMALGYIVYNFFLGNLYNAVITVVVIQLCASATALIFKGFEIEVGERKKLNGVTRRKENFPGALYILTFLFGMFLGIGNEILMFYLAEVMGMGRYLTTAFLFFAGVYSLGGSYITGFYADKMGMERAILLTAFLGMVSGVLISINHLFPVLLGTLFFYITGRAFMPLSRSYAASQSENIGTALGFINMSSNLGAVLSPIAGGIVIDYFNAEKIGWVNLSAITFVFIGFAMMLNAFFLWKRNFLRA